MSNSSDVRPPLVAVAHPLWAIVLLWVLVFIMSSLTVIGNILVLVSFYVERNIRQQASNYFIASLAVSDLIIGVEGFPILSVYVTYGEKWVIGRVTCELWLCIDYSVCLASILTVLLITVDRYCSVCYPAMYRMRLSPLKVRLLIVFSWFIPLALFSILVYGWERFTGEESIVDKSHRCEAPFLQNPYVNMALYMTYYWAVLIAIIVLYHGIHKAAAALEERGRSRDRQNIFISTQLNMAQMGAFLGGNSDKQKHSVSRVAPAQSPQALPIGLPQVVASHVETSSRMSQETKPSDRSQAKLSATLALPTHHLLPKHHAHYGTFVKSETVVDFTADRAQPTSKVSILRTYSQRLARETGSAVLSRVMGFGSRLSMLFQGSESSLGDAFGEMSLTSMASNCQNMQKISPMSSSNTHYSLMDEVDCMVINRFQPIVGEWEDSAGRRIASNYSIASICRATGKVILKPAPSTNSLMGFRRQLSQDAIVKHPSTSGYDELSELNDTLLIESLPADTTVVMNSLDSPRVEAASSSSPRLSHKTNFSEDDDDNISKIDDALDEEILPRYGGGISAVFKFIRDRKVKQSRAEKRARKAFRTITIIVGAFALFWSPYYIVATIYGFCDRQVQCVPSPVFIVSYYMCYLNSLVNPICYALANIQFRRCFARLLRGDFQRH